MKASFFSFMVILSILLVASCKKNDSVDTPTVSYSIQVQYPDNYSKTNVENAVVVLKNLTTNVESKDTSDADGTTSFSKLTPGIYSVSVSRTLSATETEGLTGLSQEVYLTGNISQLQITAEGSQTIKLTSSTVGDWVIKEFYYSGAPNSYYFYDGFVEIYNNSTDTLYADSLLFGNTKAASSSTAYGFITEGYTDVYLAFVFRIPGSGKDHPVAPGKSILIAIDAINHQSDPNGNPNSPVNLGTGVSDFEVYYTANPNTPDTDNPDVPNVDIVYAYSTTLYDYLPGVFGSGLVVFRDKNPESLEKLTEPNSTASTLYVHVPKEDIIDGLDAVANSTITADKKRLPTNIDAGMNTVGKTYSGTSLRRKVKQEINGRKVLVDTNNSTNDFEVASTPTPKGW
ncbi:MULTISPECIES: DUF4876 domain-containing protein [Chitinophagaceae]